MPDKHSHHNQQHQQHGHGASFSEDEFGKKLDRCLTDTMIKGTSGLLLGTVFSLLFFKRRPWPVILGTGFGIGVAYRTCERDLNS